LENPVLSRTHVIYIYIPGLLLGVVADDIQVAAIGPQSEVVSKVAASSKFLIDTLEQECQLPISTPKLALLATDRKVATEISRRTHRLRHSYKAQARNLGSDFAVGGSCRPIIRNQRFLKVKARVARLKWLAKSGKDVAKVVRTGIVPAYMYAANIYGVSQFNLNRFRAMVHKAQCKNAHSRSCTVDLALSGKQADPALAAISGPVVMFLACLRDGVLPRHILLRSLSGVLHDPMKASSRRAPSGPVHAAVQALQRIGWSFSKLNTLIDSQGNEYNTDLFAPKSIEKFLHAAIQRHLLEQSGQFKQVGHSPWLEPIVTLLNAKDSPQWGPRHKAMLRTLASHGVWTKKRLKDMGYSTNGLCTCGEIDTIAHRAFECPITQAFRDTYGLSSDLVAARQQQPQLQMWADSLAPCPFLEMPPPSLEPQVTWNPRLDSSFSGLGFGDGSGINGASKATLRCGWSVVSSQFLEGAIVITAELSGLCVGPLQEVNFAELFALYQYFCYALPYDGEYTYYSDSSFVVNGWRKGQQVCCSSWSIYCNLWQQVFDKAQDLGIESVHVFKVKAHRSIKTSLNMFDSLKILANQRADVLCKEAAAKHFANKNWYDRLKCQKQLIVENAKFLARVLCAHIDNFPKEDLERIPLGPRVVPDSSASQSGKHSFRALSRGGFRCILCLASSADGKATSRCMQNVLELGHRIWTTGAVHFCAVCGAYSFGRLGLLMKPCPGKANTQHLIRARRRLHAGLHPVTGEELALPEPNYPEFCPSQVDLSAAGPSLRDLEGVFEEELEQELCEQLGLV